MQIEIITEKKQRWNNQNYWLCGKYFQCRGKRLHRVVWQHFNGDIPKGFHVHHKDGNRANNQVDNLELLSSKEHLSQHMQERMADPIELEKARKSIDKARIKASEWHKSDEGRKWHSEVATGRKKPEQYQKICKYCKEQFMAKTKTSLFCSNNCSSKNWRATHPKYYSNEQSEARIQSKCTK